MKVRCAGFGVRGSACSFGSELLLEGVRSLELVLQWLML